MSNTDALRYFLIFMKKKVENKMKIKFYSPAVPTAFTITIEKMTLFIGNGKNGAHHRQRV